jgi:glycosyltransferase involved in cell wall biosynthesis
MRILSVIASLHPAAGGPVESCVLLNRKFRQMGHHAAILSCESGGEPWLQRLTTNPFLAGPSYGHYGFTPRLLPMLRELKNKFDAVIVHGIWQYQCVALLQAFQKGDPPVVVFVHGNLDPYFIDNFPFKNIKKSVHYRLVEARLFRRAHAVLFTCDEERRLASSSYRPIVGNRQTVRYGIDPPEFDPAAYKGTFAGIKEKYKDKHLILFFGRIHPKKGCDLLLHAFARIARENPSAHLLMVGPDEVGSVPKLKRLAERLGIAGKVSWLGPAYGDDKWFLFSSADVFILPSHMENFGIAIVEAMSQGTPVLISTRINIHRDIVRAGAGFSAPDTIDGTVELLTRWFSLSESERCAMGKRARQLVADRFLAAHTARDIINIFETPHSSNIHQSQTTSQCEASSR